MYYAGIDLGGSKIAVALCDAAGQIYARHQCPTPQGEDSPEKTAKAMADGVHAVLAQAGKTMDEVLSVGIGSPGTIDPQQGVIKLWTNLNFVNVPIVALLKGHLPTISAVYLDNDANAAALGEYVAGAGKGSTSMLAVTLGTGIGGGAVLDNKLYTGFNYGGMEVGHFVLEHGGHACSCGRRGCFETYCSARALLRQARAAMETDKESLLWDGLDGKSDMLNGKLFFAAFHAGDRVAREVFSQFTDYLASGIISLVNIFQPQVLCLGGGIAAQGDVILNPVREVFDREDCARNLENRTRLVTASLGNDAGMIGAALLPLFR